MASSTKMVMSGKVPNAWRRPGPGTTTFGSRATWFTPSRGSPPPQPGTDRPMQSDLEVAGEKTAGKGPRAFVMYAVIMGAGVVALLFVLKAGSHLHTKSTVPNA